jgi:hypothetical protein
MKTILSLIAFIFITNAVYAQTNAEKLTKKWKITAYETFGVKEDLKENQKKDFLQFNADKTYKGIENGNEVTGTWSVEKTNTYLTTTNSKNKETRSYKIYSVSDKEAVIEYKDATLIKTKYYLSAE